MVCIALRGLHLCLFMNLHRLIDYANKRLWILGEEMDTSIFLWDLGSEWRTKVLRCFKQIINVLPNTLNII